jgi:hypothetical protein
METDTFRLHQNANFQRRRNVNNDQPNEEKFCHTRFYKETRMHLICAPGSIYTHMIDKRV